MYKEMRWDVYIRIEKQIFNSRKFRSTFLFDFHYIRSNKYKVAQSRELSYKYNFVKLKKNIYIVKFNHLRN